MKHVVLCLALILTIQKGFTQERPYVQFNYTLPESYEIVYAADRLLVYNEEKKICVIIYAPFKGGSNIGENFMQLWNTPQKSIEGYFAGEVYKRNSLKVNGYQMMSGEFEGEANGRQFKKTLQLYQDGNRCNAVIAFVDQETNEQLQSFWKSLEIIPKAIPLSMLERSYNWYTALRGPDASNSSIQIYQSQTAINFTGFNAASQNHLQRLGDSLFYLRELPNLQMIFIGQTRFNDAAAINIGTFRAIKHVQAIDQGFAIPLTNAGLQGLSNANNLEVIDLRSADIPGVTDAGMAYLSKLTKLTKLIISRAPAVTINGIEQLTTLKQLRELNLSFCTLSDTDIPRLTAVIQQLPSLRLLFIQTTNVTEGGASLLRQTFPSLTVYR
ncbi:MAG: hypothetical protein K2X48_12595 [Chitinophagaceae bacterium]|nr:hypothetical protein [Chitinophagaceae bacterium]